MEELLSVNQHSAMFYKCSKLFKHVLSNVNLQITLSAVEDCYGYIVSHWQNISTAIPTIENTENLHKVH